MSMRFTAAINKPGYNPYGQTVTTYTYNLFSWGRGTTYGTTGFGSLTNYSSPKQLGLLTNWASALAADDYDMAVDSSGQLWGWGRNHQGQLGLGNLTPYSSPKQVGALTNWAVVDGKRQFSAAIKTDGTLWMWGYNATGELGQNNTISRSSPVQVGVLTNWAYLGPTMFSMHAVKTDGTLWSWGQNSFGQLGLGNQTYYSSPKQVGILTTWSSVSGGVYFVAATKTDGTLWTWGQNSYGQLGLGTVGVYANKSSPTQVGGLTTWLRVSCGFYSTFAIKTDGTLWSWGANAQGQLGLNNRTDYSSPKQVGALTTWSKIKAGGDCSVAGITTSGALWMWGYNNYGQLGLSNITNYSSPKQVGSSTTWLEVGISATNALARG